MQSRPAGESLASCPFVAALLSACWTSHASRFFLSVVHRHSQRQYSRSFFWFLSSVRWKRIPQAARDSAEGPREMLSRGLCATSMTRTSQCSAASSCGHVPSAILRAVDSRKWSYLRPAARRAAGCLRCSSVQAAVAKASASDRPGAPIAVRKDLARLDAALK